MKRKLGQHFLFDPNILKKIVRCSSVTAADTVVEIGPGLGTLTRVLAEQARRVIAIEFDKKLIERLEDNLSAYKNTTVVNADALKYPYEAIRGRFKVVANIPYYITTPLIFRLLEYRKKIQSMTLLMQKEVARRIVALPGSRDYGLLSVSLQLHTLPEIQFTVSRKAFSPPPDVDSAVVHFTLSPQDTISEPDRELILTLARAAFSQRRKTILNSLKSLEISADLLVHAGIDPGARPERLSLQDFARLATELAQIRKKG
jgi:16S rRNA (adenine1518-N6/adenine1519-N6)-dimethyltransferase